jgi:hypothetical protein
MMRGVWGYPEALALEGGREAELEEVAEGLYGLHFRANGTELIFFFSPAEIAALISYLSWNLEHFGNNSMEIW